MDVTYLEDNVPLPLVGSKDILFGFYTNQFIHSSTSYDHIREKKFGPYIPIWLRSYAKNSAHTLLRIPILQSSVADSLYNSIDPGRLIPIGSGNQTMFENGDVEASALKVLHSILRIMTNFYDINSFTNRTQNIFRHTNDSSALIHAEIQVIFEKLALYQMIEELE